MGDRNYFTLVFEGDITKIKGNPHKIETPYGFPVASGMGNAFDVIENLHEIEEAASKLIAAICRYQNNEDDDGGPELPRPTQNSEAK